MRITANEIIWGQFRIQRSAALGFAHREKQSEFSIFIGDKLTEVHLGAEGKAWPFATAIPGTTGSATHLVHGVYRFLPEHVLAFSNNPNDTFITVWTRLAKFKVNRNEDESISNMSLPEEFRNSLADDWIKAYTLHSTDPYLPL